MNGIHKLRSMQYVSVYIWVLFNNTEIEMIYDIL